MSLDSRCFLHLSLADMVEMGLQQTDQFLTWLTYIKEEQYLEEQNDTNTDGGDK